MQTPQPYTQRYPQLRGGEVAVAERQSAPTRVPFRCDFAATKAATLDASGNLELVGYASTWVLDRDGEYIDPRAYDDTLQAYLDKNPMLLWQHNMDWPLGQITQATIDGNGLLVRAVVRKPEKGEEPWKLSAYNDIKAGIVRTFSVGGFFTRDFVAGRIVVVEIELLEISVVSIPSNPDSIFEAAQKALGKGGSARPELPQKVVSQMEQLLGLRGMTDPELMVLEARGATAIDERYELLCSLYTKAGRMPPGREVWEEAKAEPDVHKRLNRVLDVMKHVQGRVDAKQGRVLSKANEGLLRKAVDTLADATQQLQAVLAQVDQDSQGVPGNDEVDAGKQALPVAAKDTQWGAAAANARVQAVVGAEAYAADPLLRYCDVVQGPDGQPVPALVMRAVATAAGKWLGSDDRDQTEKAAITAAYARLAEHFGDATLGPPWA